MKVESIQNKERETEISSTDSTNGIRRITNELTIVEVSYLWR